MTAHENPLQRIVAKCWQDEDFEERLVADPAATLKAEGVEIPGGVTVNVAVDTEEVRTLVIPLPPSGGLSDEELREVAAATDIVVAPCYSNDLCQYSSAMK